MTQSLSSDSDWAPYLSILPQELDSLVFWSEFELTQLQASAIRHKIGKAKAEEMFASSIAPLGLSNYSIEACHKSASIIMAYAFDIPDPSNDADGLDDGRAGEEYISDNGEDEKTILSMVPLADLLNADADRNNARMSYDNNVLEMRSMKPIAKGEEIFNDYGQLPRSDLLRRYGYVTDRYAKHDIVELPTELIRSAFCKTIELADHSMMGSLFNSDLKSRLELAEREGVYDDSYDLRHAGLDEDEHSIPDELLALFYLLLLNDVAKDSILHHKSSLPKRSKLATELVGQVIAVIIRAREQQYATSVEEDEKLLNCQALTHRERMAIHVRLGEKQILREIINEALSFTGSNTRMRRAIGPNGDAHSNSNKSPDHMARPAKKARLG